MRAGGERSKNAQRWAADATPFSKVICHLKHIQVVNRWGVPCQAASEWRDEPMEGENVKKLIMFGGAVVRREQI